MKAHRDTLEFREPILMPMLPKEYGMPVGIYVYKIVEGGAAANSDLKRKGQSSPKFDGQSVTNMEELSKMLT